MSLKLLSSGRLPVILSQCLKHNQPLFRTMFTEVDSTFISEINAAEKAIASQNEPARGDPTAQA